MNEDPYVNDAITVHPKQKHEGTNHFDTITQAKEAKNFFVQGKKNLQQADHRSIACEKNFLVTFCERSTA